MTESKTITYKEIASLVGMSVRSVHANKEAWGLPKYQTAHKMPIQFWRGKVIAHLKELCLIEN